MKTKNIFKTLAFAMLMPAMMLTTACSNDDDLINNTANTENTINKGYALPVTVNVTREGGATRATFDGSKLNFSTGDKLFVEGGSVSTGSFAGTLDYVPATGKFSGTIYTYKKWTDTADELFTAAIANSGYITATLLPNGYKSYGYLSIYNNNTYDDYVITSATYTLATSKADGVAQFSYEKATTYSSGFALAPQNAILNFTITGLAASTNVDVSLTGSGYTITKTVTTDGSGNATFSAGVEVEANTDLNELSLTVGGNAVTLVNSSTPLAAGKIYNITRSAAPAPAATSLSELKTAINGGTDCSSYIGWEVNSAGAIAESGISGTKIGYVAYVSTSDVDADVSGSRILVIASADAAANTTWGSKGTARGLTADDLNGYSNTNTLQGYGSEAHPAAYAAWNYSATIPSGGATPAHWFMPTKKQWENMRDAKGGTYGAMATAYGISGHYWTSTEVNNNNAWRFVTNSNIQSNMKSLDFNVRSIFAY